MYQSSLENEKRSRSLMEVIPSQFDNNPSCIHLSKAESETEPSFDCTTDLEHYSVDWTRFDSIDISDPISEVPPLLDRNGDFSKHRIWNRMFKNSLVPKPQDGAVEESFGILTEFLEVRNDEEVSDILDDIIREVKGK
ncbi:MAG: hypothetical protein ACTSSE_12305 [Candidatus Thorarchaeota archaeon]